MEDEDVPSPHRTSSGRSLRIRRRLRAGAPDAEVLAQFPAGFAKLDDAEARLSGR